MGSFKDLIVYKKAFVLAMEIFEMTKDFPIEEKYSLIDQIRRSSDQYVHVWQKRIVKEGTSHISYRKQLIQIWKIQKPRCG